MSFKLLYKHQFHILSIYSVTHCRVSSNLKHSNLTLWLIIHSLKAHDYSPYCRVIVLLVLHKHIRVVVRRSHNNSLDALSSGRVYVVVSIFLVLRRDQNHQGVGKRWYTGVIDISNLACSGLSQLRSRCVRGRIIYTGYKGTLKPVVLELLV